jgi:hypothetical protein
MGLKEPVRTARDRDPSCVTSKRRAAMGCADQRQLSPLLTFADLGHRSTLQPLGSILRLLTPELTLRVVSTNQKEVMQVRLKRR